MKNKRYKAAAAMVDRKKLYTPLEAAALVKKMPAVGFDASIDLAVKLGIDGTQADQQVRSAISLPHGNGKKVRILAICDPAQADEAIKAGADFAGGKDMIEKIKGGWLDFDLIVTGPQFMLELGKQGKVLGPRGLMPNPKAGTVAANIPATVGEFKRGKQEYRTDKDGNVHLTVGKVSFPEQHLAENIEAFLAVLRSKKPSSVKGDYMTGVALSATMSPAVRVALPAQD